MGDVTELRLVTVGEDFRFKAREILEAAKAYDFEKVAIIGRLENGELYLAGTANAGETLILLKHAEHFIAFETDGLDR